MNFIGGRELKSRILRTFNSLFFHCTQTFNNYRYSGFILSKKFPLASIDIMIFKNNKLLLGKLSDKWIDNGKYEWGLPGREIEFGADFEETARKNLKEEMEMQLISFKVICVNNNFALGNHYISIGILAEAEGELKLNSNEDWKL